MVAQPITTSDHTLSISFLSDTMHICVVTRAIYRTMRGMLGRGFGPWAVHTKAARMQAGSPRGSK